MLYQQRQWQNPRTCTAEEAEKPTRQITSVNIGTPGWTFWNQPFPFLCHNLGELLKG